MAKGRKTSGMTFLGVEGGGTRTVAMLADAEGRPLRRFEAGPANIKLLSDRDLVRHFRIIGASMPRPGAMAIGLAGAWAKSDRDRIQAAAAKVWPRVPCYATHDLKTALTAAANGQKKIIPRVLIISGTGSCCYGENPLGDQIKVGGWGHVLGDKGSGYEIGLRALKAVALSYDRDGVWPRLGQGILTAFQLNEPEDLIEWGLSASKGDIAKVALTVFDAWEFKDAVADQILAEAVENLAQDAAACARKLGVSGQPIEFVLAGGTLLKQPHFARRLARRLQTLHAGAIVSPLRREGVWGAVELARALGGNSERVIGRPTREEKIPSRLHGELTEINSRKPSPTEARNPRSENLGKLPIRKAIALMLSEEARTPLALQKTTREIEQVIQLIARAFKRGRRLYYVGAGTSGRLGVLDASECPPTFGVRPEMVQGIMAGGQGALWRSVEGAEDNREAGARAIEFRGVAKGDVVIGIAASGRTPFVWGALGAAKRRQAETVLVCFNPYLEIPALQRPTVTLAVDLGPEVLTGSTRLKAGTATKLLLNLFTTLAMVRLGKVASNLMIDLRPTNVKLRDRAVRITCELTGRDRPHVEAALERSGWVIKKAIARLNRQPWPRVEGTSRARSRT